MALGSMISILRSFPAYGSSRIWQFKSGMKARGNLAFWNIIFTGFDSFCQPSMETHHSHAHITWHCCTNHQEKIRNIKHSTKKRREENTGHIVLQLKESLAAVCPSSEKRMSKERSQNQRHLHSLSSEIRFMTTTTKTRQKEQILPLLTTSLRALETPNPFQHYWTHATHCQLIILNFSIFIEF